MQRDKVKFLTYVAMYIALYVVLKFVGNLIPFLKMPQGGSIELELIALFMASYHLGFQAGVLVAGLSWLITFMLGIEMWFVHPVQILLDYVLPLGIIGLASVFPKKYGLAIVLPMLIKYGSQVLSGVYYWPPKNEAAGSTAAWIFSLNYNAWYNLATLVICLLVVPLLWTRIQRLVK
ncbi:MULTISPECIES: energy-coupled thiamine transporter ThiT [Terrabacteria group]|uniref:energy-coupled thiamine transporter ThiT n=1 Tax=Bacillati TaxID=1783272 RepID=UPI00193A9B1C|nr:MULTISPECIES: energy-coupled thiamine transporter ThiT [Terrabacteria group]MBW9212570.1 energy-coupled thiamine transporter ThiT [Trueperella sp. zg.1013]QRG86678.1 energy-coupled thiamine transporter ThiT [Bulleidia sp. zg-1006]